MPDREQIARWLLAEQREQEDAADAALTSLFAALPRVEPSATFQDRTVAAIRAWRGRRRRLTALAWTTAALVTVAAMIAALAAAPYVGPWMVKTLALVGARCIPWMVSYATVAVSWWWTLGRIGGHVSEAIATPARLGMVVGVELIGILAFFALQRVAGAGRFGEARI